MEDRRVLAVVTVTTEFDTFDYGDGLTSLREAIFATNLVAGADTIEFDASLVGKTILLELGELAITDDLTINGLGAEFLSIDAQQQSRIFNIMSATGDFTITEITLTNGRTTGDSGTSGGA